MRDRRGDERRGGKGVRVCERESEREYNVCFAVSVMCKSRSINIATVVTNRPMATSDITFVCGPDDCTVNKLCLQLLFS